LFGWMNEVSTLFQCGMSSVQHWLQVPVKFRKKIQAAIARKMMPSMKRVCRPRIVKSPREIAPITSIDSSKAATEYFHTDANVSRTLLAPFIRARLEESKLSWGWVS